MIINYEREPELSLYYLGGIALSILVKEPVIQLDELFAQIQKKLGKDIHVDFLYYTLDWLFLLSAVKIEEGMVYYENKKTDSTQNKAL